MKLSNKILIGLFSIIFLYLLAAFTEIRFRGNPKVLGNSDSVSEFIELKEISYLLVSDLNQHVTIVGSDKPRIEVQSIEGNLAKHLNYTIKNDTLLISATDLEEKQLMEIFIYLPSHTLKGLLIKKSGVFIRNLNQETLMLSQNDGWVNMNGNNKVNKLQIEIENAGQFSLTESSIDTLLLSVNNSRASVNSSLKLAEISLSNKANVNMSNANEIRLKKDDSSRIFLN